MKKEKLTADDKALRKEEKRENKKKALAEKQEKKQQKILLLSDLYKKSRREKLLDGKLKKKGKIALCLGGGGARGFAHIGVLKALEEAGFDFDICVGTSAGSLVGALACGGVTPERIFKYGEMLDMKEIHGKNILFPQDTDGIKKIIYDLIGEKKIEDLQKPFCAVATDLISASEVMFTDGDLATAVAASCCVPQFFKPVIYRDMHLVDGGLLNNIPADICRVMGADYVVTVDVNPTRTEGTEETGSIAVIKATISIMMSNSSYKGYINSDVIIAPDTGDFKSYSKNGYEQMYEIGYKAAKERIDEIIEKLYW